MSLLDKASLIVTPNAYKESKLYSVVPNTTLGDMTVVRATTATRVNSAGLIEVVPRNLLTYSNTFTNAVWGNGGYGNIATVIANDIISPDGLMNGSKITFSAGVTQGRLIQQTSVINGGIYEASIFVKYGNKNTIQFYCDAAVIGLFATFNFTTKVLTGSGVSNTIVTELPNGWFRLQYTYTAPSATSQIGFISNVGEDGFIYAYGGQVEIGSTATEYFPTTTRLNIPRIDYTNGSCPSLLVEPQRTNVLTYSEQFDNVIWNKLEGGGNNPVVTPNFAISPDGTQNADKIVFSSSTSFINGVFQYFPNFSGIRTASVWLRSATGTSTIYITTQDDVTGGNYTLCNLTTEWQRFNVSYTTNAIGTQSLLIGYYTNIGTNTGPASTTTIYAWGAQLEAGSYPTSYIPTVASSVTRNADVISKTGISSLIGQTEGTLFIDFNHIGLQSDSNGSVPIVIKGTVAEAYILITGGGTLVAELYNTGSQCVINGAIGAVGRKKIAFGYKNNDFVMYMNGVLIGTDTTGTVGSMTELFVGSYYSPTYSISSGVNSAQLYKTRLSNSELAQLTTL